MQFSPVFLCTILPGVSVYYFHIEFMNPGTVYMYLYHQEVPQILLFFVMVSKTTMVAKQGISNRYLQMNFRHISLYDSHKGHNFLLVSYRKRFSDYSLGIPARHHLAIYNSFKSSRTRTPMLVSAVRLYRSVINCTESERSRTVARWTPFFLCSHQQSFLSASQVLSVGLRVKAGD